MRTGSSTWWIWRPTPSAFTPPIIPAIPGASNRKSHGGDAFCSARSGGRRSGGAPSVRLVAAGDRISPVAAEGAAAHADARRCLTALVFVAFHEIQNTSDRLSIEAPHGNLVHRKIFLDEGFQNGVQDLVRRQAVGVLLIRPQLRRRGSFDHSQRNHR